LSEYLKKSTNEFEEKILEEIFNFVKKTLPESKDILVKNLDEKIKNFIRSKDLIVFGDI
jgi:hypothetical protein